MAEEKIGENPEGDKKEKNEIVEQKIKDLDSNSRNVNLTANIVKMDEPKEITTRFGRTTVANAELEDDTDKIKLVLWGDQTQACNEGDKVRITNGFVKEWNNEKQLSVGKYGKIEKVE